MPFDQPVLHIMTECPITLDIEHKLSDARAVFADGRFHHLPVVADGKLAGILSSSDLVKLSHMYGEDDDSLNEFLDRQYTIDALMKKKPITIGVEATIREAAQTLAAGGFHSLPVIGYDGTLKGIVTTSDLIKLLLEKLG